jgi:transcriptional regulator with XRE-family HTH domain
MKVLKLDEYYAEKYMDFLRHLREARLGTGMTQQEVAARLGKSQSYVSRSENGERRIDVVELQAFVEVYGLHLSEYVLHTMETSDSERHK